MTREEASFILANIDRRVCDDELSEALDMAIKALEQEPCEDWHDIPSNEMNLAQARQAVRDLRKFVMDNHILPKLQSCEDAVSRQSVKDIIHKYKNDSECLISWVMDSICDLPSVTTTRKVGKWIPIPFALDYKSDAKCSVCKESFIDAINYNYCPNCGAKMKGGHNG